MLDIASNRIKKIENISHLTELQEFWVSAGLVEINIHAQILMLKEIPFLDREFQGGFKRLGCTYLRF